MNATHNTDIWRTEEKQGDKVLHTIRTRDTATAMACMAAPELLEALRICRATMPLKSLNSFFTTKNESGDDLTRTTLAAIIDAAIEKAEGK